MEESLLFGFREIDGEGATDTVTIENDRDRKGNVFGLIVGFGKGYGKREDEFSVIFDGLGKMS